MGRLRETSKRRVRPPDLSPCREPFTSPGTERGDKGRVLPGSQTEELKFLEIVERPTFQEC